MTRRPGEEPGVTRRPGGAWCDQKAGEEPGMTRRPEGGAWCDQKAGEEPGVTRRPGEEPGVTRRPGALISPNGLSAAFFNSIKREFQLHKLKQQVI